MVLECWVIDRTSCRAIQDRTLHYFGSSTGDVRFAVVDDLVVVHDCGTRVSFVYDLEEVNADGPVGGGRMVERGNYIEMGGERRDEGVKEIYDGSWMGLEPNKVLDPEGRGTVWDVKVDLGGLEKGMDLRTCMGVMSRRVGRGREARAIMISRLREAVEEGDEERVGEWFEEWAAVYGEGEDDGMDAKGKTSAKGSVRDGLRRLSVMGAGSLKLDAQTGKESGGFNLPESPTNSATNNFNNSGFFNGNDNMSPFGFEDPERTRKVMKKVLSTIEGSSESSALFSFTGGEYEELKRKGGNITVSQNDIIESVLLPALEKEGGIKHVKNALLVLISSVVKTGCNVNLSVVALATEVLCRCGESRLAVGLLRSKEGGQELYGRDEVNLAKIVCKIGDKHDRKYLSLHGVDMLKRIGTKESKGVIVSRFLEEGDFIGAVREGKAWRGMGVSGGDGWPTSGDFWRAAVKKAEEAEEGERARLLYLLFVFLKGYREGDISTKIGKGGGETVSGGKRRGSKKEQERSKGLRVESALALEVGTFPDGLIKNQQVKSTLKGMFGFAS